MESDLLLELNQRMNLGGSCPTGYESLGIWFTWELSDVDVYLSEVILNA